MASDLYGFTTSDLDTVRNRVEGILAFRFEDHESTYVSQGHYYSKQVSKNEAYSIEFNYDATDDEWAEDEHKEMGVLLKVGCNDQQRSDAIRALLARVLSEAVFLQRETITDDGRFQRIRNENGKDIIVFEKCLSDLNVVAKPA